MGQQDRHEYIDYRNFQPTPMDQSAMICTQELIPKSENTSGDLPSCSYQDNFSKLKGHEVEWLLRDLLHPLDFSGIPRYPNDYKDLREEIPWFHELSDSPILHIA
jgi:hypothetical protein